MCLSASKQWQSREIGRIGKDGEKNWAEGRVKSSKVVTHFPNPALQENPPTLRSTCVRGRYDAGMAWQLSGVTISVELVASGSSEVLWLPDQTVEYSNLKN